MGAQTRAENVLSVESDSTDFSVLRGQGRGRQNCSLCSVAEVTEVLPPGPQLNPSPFPLPMPPPPSCSLPTLLLFLCEWGGSKPTHPPRVFIPACLGRCKDNFRHVIVTAAVRGK